MDNPAPPPTDGQGPEPEPQGTGPRTGEQVPAPPAAPAPWTHPAAAPGTPLPGAAYPSVSGQPPTDSYPGGSGALPGSYPGSPPGSSPVAHPTSPYPVAPPPGYPASSAPGYPGSPAPGYPASSAPGYPGSPAPGYPGSPAPGVYPGVNPGVQPPYSYPGQPQQDYPNDPRAYPYAQVPYLPPPRSGRRRGWIIGGAAAIVLVVTAIVIVIVLVAAKGESPTTMALKAGQAIAPAAGLTLAGTMDGTSASVTVTRAGTVEGSYTQAGNQVSRITIEGVTYLRAPVAFWTDNAIGQTGAGQAAGKWAKAPADMVIMKFSSLTPGQISRALEHVGKHPAVIKTVLDGRKVIRLSRLGITYYITRTSPNRLLGVRGGSGRDAYSFGITPLTTTTIGPVFTILQNDVQSLRNAPDPGAIVLPHGKIHFDSNCKSDSSCTVSSSVTLTDPGSSLIFLKMTVDFSGTRNGSAFTTCTDTVQSLALDTVSLSCGVKPLVWSVWVDSHLGNFNTWGRPHFAATVNSASDVTALQGELAQEQQVVG
jgi:hypothetical protein